jgi:hypothetical protein
LSDLDDPKSGYPELANELRKLPEFHQNTPQSNIAVQRIATLALQSDDPQVREAFEIMLEGGTPSPNDFSYLVPNWNTELQVLCWLGEQSEFKKNDTLAQSIAMNHGIYVTMGTDEVKQAVYRDVGDFLNFLRETNDAQKADGRSELEAYLLEAKVALTCRGIFTCSPEGGPFSLAGNVPSPTPWPDVNFLMYKLELPQYQWDTVSLDTLTGMNTLVEKNGWYRGNAWSTVNFLDGYFFDGLWDVPNPPGHWNYTPSWSDMITIDGVELASRNFVNVNFQYQYFLEHGYGIGVCNEEAAFEDAILKSYGIASLGDGWEKVWNGQLEGDDGILYFDPSSNMWKGPELRATKWNLNSSSTLTGFLVFKPPVVQARFLRWKKNPESTNKLPVYVANSRHSEVITFQGMHDRLVHGIDSADVKKWILSEGNHAI